MAYSFLDIVRSDLFTFLIGADKSRVVVHSNAIAVAAEPLDRLMHGSMGEAQTKCAEIRDVDIDDFIRFCEYAYRGDYAVPACEDDVLDDEGSVSSAFAAGPDGGNVNASPVPVDDDWAPLSSKKKKKTKTGGWDGRNEPHQATATESKTARSTLRTQFNNHKYCFYKPPRDGIVAQFEPRLNKAAEQDFTNVFLAHARLYTFAVKYMIAPLKTLTLHKLYKTLAGFKLYHSRVKDILELARYTYTDEMTANREKDGTLDELRQLVVEYIVCEINVIGTSDEFSDLLEDGGQFAGDFWGIMRTYAL